VATLDEIQANSKFENFKVIVCYS